MTVDDNDEQVVYNQEGIVRETTALSGTLYFSQLLYVVRGFIIAHVLGPSIYGVWSIFRSFFGSATYFGLGTQQAMLREVPFSVGEGNREKKSIIIQTSLTWNILVATLVMVLVVILSFTNLFVEFKTEVRLASILFLLNAVHLFIRPKFKSEQKIILLSKYMFSYAVLNTLFGLSLLFLFKLNGLLLGMIVAQLILLTYLIINKHLSLRLSIDKKILSELFHIGFPIMVLWLLIFLISNMNKLIVFIMLGKRMAGYYGLAAFVSSIVGYISYSVTSVIFPRMMYTYGKTGKREDVEKYFTKPMLILSGLIPVILGFVFINVKEIVSWLLPQYLPGIIALQILIVSLFFSTILSLPANLLIAFNKQKKFMYMMAVILLISITSDLIVIKLGFGINGVAVVSTIIFLFSSGLANGYALFSLRNSITEILRNLIKIYLPFVYSFIGVLIIVSFSLSDDVFWDNSLKSALFFVFSIPLIIYIEKKSSIITKIFSTIKIFKK